MFEVRTDLALEEQEPAAGAAGVFPGDFCPGGGVGGWGDPCDHGADQNRECRENDGETQGNVYHAGVFPAAGGVRGLSPRYFPEAGRASLASGSGKKRELSVLVAGLGNRSVTPDALGPQVADNLCITRHLLEEYGSAAFANGSVQAVSAVVPGVMAQTGMETGEILSGIIRQVRPDCLIAIDALAARSARRLCRTIQISDTGICPGSGVGNHRHSITEKTVGVPVIALGIPTVVEAATIVQDSMAEFLRELSRMDSMPSLTDSWEKLDEAEHRELVRGTAVAAAESDVCHDKGYRRPDQTDELYGF